MKEPQASSGHHPIFRRDLAFLAGIAVAAFAVGRFTPLFEYAFAWARRLGMLETLTGVLVSVAFAAVVLLVGRYGWVGTLVTIVKKDLLIE